MTKIYNRTSEKEKRRQLRNNMTQAEIILWSRLKSRQVFLSPFAREATVGLLGRYETSPVEAFA